MIKLSNASLPLLPDGILRPTYDRAMLRPGIVHIGMGNFHRAHQAWYLHRLMEQGLALDWAIIGAGVRAYDTAQREKLVAQDFLTTLIALDPSGTSAEVVGSVIGYVPIADGNGPLIREMADPQIRIVSLTVTEGGYYIDPVTKAFDAAHTDIVHDAANPATPRTAFGAIVAALRLRRDGGTGPFTVQSCDNLQGNGAILRQTVVSLARLSDPALADWINAHCSFPNSMVDCIVPATGPKELALAQGFGIDDAVPVTHENFRQWVIEDDFCAGRPDWDKVGAMFSDNVHGYEAQKIRILNAGHQVIASVAEVMGLTTISETMAHPAIHALFRKVAQDEIIPHVIPVPGMTPAQYVDLIDSRFANPAIVDTVRRVAFDGSSRHPGMVLPTVRDGLRAGAPVRGLALVEAAWARMCEGTRDDGSKIAPNDPFWDMLTETAGQARRNPRAWLEQRQFYGDLADAPRFADAFDQWLTIMYQDGMEAAVQRYLDGR
ncbi:MAG: mannitol dehydrogenase family protein [Pseudotabrizicola sp.]|uniref:mannitol dehydrogenase family protein n=1 Tax=Pseudotabrizicola sp. TaxID=2939647 RepID=UPI00272F6E96|nr:mannitol dehydrogenase family protein [Pseudotabrizicola sp.]MDP2083246.1 mannitol dehydrogenase family protein [Pseudotabrizicola sp.]MDZ7575951.1 mannitol dehydrogenase family protein [Pseudotabrizicola sp.]